MATHTKNKKATTRNGGGTSNASNHRNHYDIDAVKFAARSQWPTIISTIGGVDARTLDGRHHPCPKCGGNDRFRMIDQAAGGLICNHCARTGIGDGFAALSWLLNKPFADVLADVAQYLGIKPSASSGNSATGGQSTDPTKNLEFKEWNEGEDLLLAIWCLSKKPILPHAVKSLGGRVAIYRKEHKVIALPVWGPKLNGNNDQNNSQPVGWVIYAIGGGLLPKWSKSATTGEVQRDWVKVKLTHGSQPGVLCDLSRIKSPEITTIYKVEGVTDLLTALSLADVPANTTFITNANGASERPADWVTSLFSSKIARVIHDADEPGENGAIGWTDPRTGQHRSGWCQEIALKATECKHVKLPFQIEKSHGKDLRDYLLANFSFNAITTLADSPASSVIITAAASQSAHVNESEDDPYRLARINLVNYAKSNSGATLRYWRSEWYKYNGTHFREIKEEELEAKVSQAIKFEFDRLNVEALENWKNADGNNRDDEPPLARKVSITLVKNVIRAMASETIIPNSVELNTWYDRKTKTRKHRKLIAFQNGLLDIERFISSNPEHDNDTITDVLLPHSECWFSNICLPYKFDPDAKCPVWEQFLIKNLEQDDERIALLQEWAGYLLLPDTTFQRFLALEGEGSNGKSVFLAGVTALLGKENCSFVPLERFSERFDKTSTLGKLANVSADSAELDKLAEGYLKSFTSGDLMHFDRKGISAIEAVPTARLMLAFNNRPRFSDRSSGIWRRMLLVPWQIEIAKRDRVKGMDKIEFWQRNNELPGMFNWAIAGLARLREQNDFTTSKVCEAALEDYRREVNPARSFLIENCESSESFSTPVLDLYKLYRQWCTDNGIMPFGERQFGKEIYRTFRNVERRRLRDSTGRRYEYAGIKLIGSEIDEKQNDSFF